MGASTRLELPPPSPEAAAHSARVRERIAVEIEAAGGAIPFRRYMELALYAPGLGYYMAGTEKLGPGGDFVTAPEVSPLFAACLARQVAEVLERLGGGEVLELGAGSGRLAAGLLAALERLGAAPARYRILEVSGELAARQRAHLAAALPAWRERIVWARGLPEAGFRGVVIANEVLDAMPVERFERTAEGVVELGVRRRGEGFAWTALPPAEDLAAAVAGIEAACGRLPAGYRSERNPQLAGWVAALGEILEAGVVLLVDYGYPRCEYYHPERADGTLRCHYRHRAHDDPFLLPGIQDITAHVDFTAVAEAAVAAGLEVAGYTTQAQFLLATGLAELAAEAADALTRARRAAEVKRLVMPSEMGEAFKVMALARGIEGPLGGFALRDLRGRL
ncbi:class I SAM-dependent methyltransferase [Inmirania thermothiophila]|uniref:SAM-dependent MidA family methyltransferase n=1 Tax=Inmirania thermothiophila TaxID=1750597 RepID=A0A3N1Y7M7_9GAMM|nr:SAM-dependent methyltransferase [Inmirania thermothiophila]ROR34521.1 SAM-dependent MidA family methyltransferase [Inmirania thermothiophila]